MEYVVVVLLAVLVVLVGTVAAGLRKIEALLDKLLELPRAAPESSERRQTVTVNVGAVPGAQEVPVKVLEEAAAPNSPAPVSAEPSLPKLAARTASVSRTGAGGIAIVKCSHCGAENTSFRHECFSCGKAL